MGFHRTYTPHGDGPDLTATVLAKCSNCGMKDIRADTDCIEHAFGSARTDTLNPDIECPLCGREGTWEEHAEHAVINADPTSPSYNAPTLEGVRDEAETIAARLTLAEDLGFSVIDDDDGQVVLWKDATTSAEAPASPDA